MLTLINVVSGACPLFLPMAPSGYRWTAALGMASWLLGLLLQVLAVWAGQLWLFVAAFVPLGVGMGVYNLLLHVECTVWWSDNVPRPHAISGFFIGLGAIVHALLFGLLSSAVGVLQTLLIVAALHTLLMGAAWRVGFSRLSFYDKRRPDAATPQPGGGSSAESEQRPKAGEESRPTPSLQLLCTGRMLGVLLRRIDGFDSQQAAAARDAGAGAAGRSIVVCATNRREDLDAALLSRFDLTLTFGLPDAPARAAILALYARHLGAPARARLAAMSAGCSGRDLKEACQATERRWASLRIRGVVVDGDGNGGADGEGSEGDRLAPPEEEYAQSLQHRQRHHTAGSSVGHVPSDI